MLLTVLVASVAAAQSARVVLRWKEAAGASAYELQIARDSAFVEVVLQTRTTTAGYRWDQLPSSTHWWRVRSIDAEGRPSEWSAPRSLATDSPTPTAIRPADGVQLSCGSSVVLEVESSALVKEYVVELATSAELTSARTLRSSTPVFDVGALASGSWWWRAKGVDLKGRTSEPGPIHPFTVRLAAPKPKPVADVPLGTPQVQLSWSEVPCAKSYVIEATLDGRDKVSLLSPGPSFAFKAPQAGEYRWRVAGVDERGATGELSAENVFRVKLMPPTGRTEQVSVRADLSWTAVPNAVGYKVEVQRDVGKGFEAFASPVVNTPSWKSAELTPGAYRWRVLAKDAAGHVSPMSDFRNFVRAAGAPLAMPELDWADEERVLAVGATIQIRWSGVADARGYEVEVDGTASRVVLTSWESSAFAEGAHTIRVRAWGDGYRFSDWVTRELYAGRPAVARAEVEVRGEVVAIRLVDAKSRPVDGGSPRFAVRQGTLGPARREGSAWLAAWTPPSGGDDVLLVDDGALHLEVPLSVPRLPTFTVALRGGGIFSGGAVASPSAVLGVGARLPVLQQRVGLELRAGVYWASSQWQVGGTTVHANAQVLPISVLVGWHQSLGAFQLRAAIGPAVQLTWLQVSSDAGFAAVMSGELVVSLSRALGPGRLEFELGGLYGRVDSALAKLNAGGGAVRVGYAFDF